MTQGLQILTVDDEPTVRRAIKILLEHAGHKVWEAESGELALQLLAVGWFDVVITDFFMPGMQGDQLISRIRQMRPAQPIIMATANPEEYFACGQPAGRVDALLRKPFTLKELFGAIEQVLTLHSHDQPNSFVASDTQPQNVLAPTNP